MPVQDVMIIVIGCSNTFIALLLLIVHIIDLCTHKK